MGVESFLGRRVTSLDTTDLRATDDQGDSYSFAKALLATGVSPRVLEFGREGIIYYRGYDDYRNLRHAANNSSRFALIGGGFIGSELAASLTTNGKKVFLAFPGPGIGSSIFPIDLALNLNDYYREKGVEVLPESAVFGADRNSISVKTKEGHERIESVDCVVAGIGTTPNVDLAKAADLEVENGIKVNAALQTSNPNIFAAGDVVSYYDQSLQRWRRVEHEDNANTMGKAAGESMAGEPTNYDHLPFFYSDLFDLGYEAVGDLDSKLDTFSDWKDPFREGVVYYFRDGRVVGVLLWNVWDQVDAARDIIRSKVQGNASELKGLLPRG
jgi:3-phenylpropionate/trans-cinnamate dioxygenase ferredoxin reductase subunit